MEIDVNKIMGNPKTIFEYADALIKAHNEIIDALNIMQSTVENFEDKEILQGNKERMIEYFNKFKKDEIFSN